MKKRVLTLALTLALCLGLAIPGMAAASDFVVENGVLVEYRGNSSVVTIPSNVKVIGTRAFKQPWEECNLTKVIIPEGVTELRNSAFEGCYDLREVELPSSLRTIGKSAFWSCALETLEVPEGVTTIGDYAFQECWDLVDITLPASLTSIGEGAFESCWDCSLTCPFDSYAYNWALEQPNSFIITSPLPVGDFSTPDPVAYPATQMVELDGRQLQLQCYALRDGNGNDTNYVKLRDLADIVNGSAAQFEVGWNGSVTITTGRGYTRNGSEQNTPFSGQRTYKKAAGSTLVNGQAADLDSFQLMDDNGGGYTYYKLRDLGAALGFNVGWSAGRGVYIETNKPYDPNN